MKTKPQLILASNSIGRKLFLEKLGVKFEVIPSQIDEDNIIHKNPIKMIQMRAKAKAEDVTKQITINQGIFNKSVIPAPACFDMRSISGRKAGILKISGSSPKITKNNNYLILAADSMAIYNGKTYGKCKTKAEGKKLLQDLMGKTHDFVTATSIVYCHPEASAEGSRRIKQSPTGFFANAQNDMATTRVTLRQLSPKELDSYVSYFDFTRFAAGYALNEKPWDLVTKIDGSYTNVIGLPFEIVLPIFRQFGIVK